MRVIAGIAKGKTLTALEGTEVTRPTSDRVKEALFGSIQFDLQDAEILDAFSGSGALSIEALSRGAKRAVMVEKERAAVEIIKKNLAACGLSDKAQILEGDFLLETDRIKGPFDFIFLDPPYRAGLYEGALLAISERGLLKEDGKIICEHDDTAALGDLFVQIKQKKYGKTYLSVLGRK